MLKINITKQSFGAALDEVVVFDTRLSADG